MKNREVIQRIIDQHYHEWLGRPIEPDTTRDQLLWGDAEAECTGVAAAIYASPEVITRAAEAGANLIVCHESLFWNHGDHTDWLAGQDTFEHKKRLLQQTGITVWRDHDHIHAGMDWQGRRVDGIFYGLLRALGWDGYVQGDVRFPLQLTIPPMPTAELAALLMDRLQLNGIKCLGDTQGASEHLYLPAHILGRDNDKITCIEAQGIDTVLAMECIDFTAGLYVRDAAQLGKNRRILVVGHFNLEQPGMKWFGEEWLPTVLPGDLPVRFIPNGDMFRYFVR